MKYRIASIEPLGMIGIAGFFVIALCCGAGITPL
jgi:hypothetical protein